MASNTAENQAVAGPAVRYDRLQVSPPMHLFLIEEFDCQYPKTVKSIELNGWIVCNLPNG
jgi:hypothetical protein